MTIQITAEGLRKIYPKAPRDIIEDRIADWQRELDRTGISHTRTRLSYFFANIEYECGGFTIKNLTENTNYSHKRVAQVWPNRYKSEEAVRARFGSASGWQLKMFDEIYGNRMGNRPGTRDGSTYIGRGGPQWTGRDGYAELQRRTGVPAVNTPTSVAEHGRQPEICAAFWAWKKLNAKADLGDFKGAVKLWNGGTNGMADRLAQMAGNDPIIARLAVVDRVMPEAKALPGSPPTKAPPQDVINETTKKERATQKAGTGGAVVGGAGEAMKAGTEMPETPFLSPFLTYSLIGIGVGVVIIAAVLIARKKAAVIKNWF